MESAWKRGWAGCFLHMGLLSGSGTLGFSRMKSLIGRTVSSVGSQPSPNAGHRPVVLGSYSLHPVCVSSVCAMGAFSECMGFFC